MHASRAEHMTVAAVDRAARADRARSDLWPLVDLTARQRAMTVAGLPRERAADPLATFTQAERGRICAAISAHCAQLEFIGQCMSGRAL